MKFKWNSSEARQNLKKHKLSFEEACYIFSDEFSLTLFDKEHSKVEDRWITIGVSLTGKIIVINHTFKIRNNKEIIRIISARKANKIEQKQYISRRGDKR